MLIHRSIADQIDPRIIERLRGRIGEFQQRRSDWVRSARTEEGAAKCADSASRKKGTTWTDGGSSFARLECTKAKRLCCKVIGDKIQLLPIYRAQVGTVFTPADDEHWLEG